MFQTKYVLRKKADIVAIACKAFSHVYYTELEDIILRRELPKKKLKAVYKHLYKPA